LNAIAFTDSLSALAVGDGGLILHTTDGGTSWDPMIADIPIGDSSLTLCDVAYPSRSKAMIASSTGEVFIYQTDPLLEMPNITFPKYGAVVPKDVTITWDPVIGATHYHVVLIVDNTKKTVVDTVVEDTYFIYSDSVSRQYNFYVTAFNDVKTSNPNHRIIRFFIPASATSYSRSNRYLYLAFSPSLDGKTMHLRADGINAVDSYQSTDLRLYDILGREQMNLSDKLLSREGSSVDLYIPITSLSSGVYFAVLRCSNGEVSGKMVIVR
jgi:hypothetical protein